MAPIPKLSASPEPLYTVLASALLSYLAYKLTAALVPLLAPDLIAKGLGGVDMLKPGFERAPDSNGAVDENGVRLKPRPKGKMLSVLLQRLVRWLLTSAFTLAGPKRPVSLALPSTFSSSPYSHPSRTSPTSCPRPCLRSSTLLSRPTTALSPFLTTLSQPTSPVS